MRIRVLIVLAALAAIAALALPGLGQAATIPVTTTADTIDDDAECSLREAVTAANTDGPFMGCPEGDGTDLIRVPKGTYTLSLGSYGDDANLGGDLDITESVIIEGAAKHANGYALGRNARSTFRYGSKAKRPVIQNGIGLPDTRGDGDRVIDIDPAGSGGVDVTIRNVAIVKGDLGCNTPTVCNFGASGVDQHGDGSLTLEHVRVAGNHVSCFHAQCDVDGTALSAAIRSATGRGDLTIRHSQVVDNHGTCGPPGCPTVTDGDAGNQLNIVRWIDPAGGSTEGNLAIEGSLVAYNTLRCEGACNVDDLFKVDAKSVTLKTSLLKHNDMFCEGPSCRTQEMFDLIVDPAVEPYVMKKVRLIGNRNRCVGDGCSSADIVDSTSGGAALIFEWVTFARNETGCVGEICDSDDIVDSMSGTDTVSWKHVSFVRNVVSCSGTSCDIDDITDSMSANEATDTRTLVDVKYIGNVSRCVGASCKGDDIADRFGSRPWGSLRVRNMLFLGNRVVCSGAGCSAQELADGFFATNVDVRGLKMIGNLISCTGAGCVTRDLADVGGSSGTLTIDRTVIVGNTIRTTGAGSIPGGSPDEQGPPSLLKFEFQGDPTTGTLSRAVIAKNRSDHSAVTNDRGDLTLDRAKIWGNRTAATGGGLLSLGEAGGTATTIVKKSMISKNRASGNGGGVANLALSAMELRDTVVSRNGAGGTGGGVFNAGAFGSTNSAIVGNAPNQCTGCP